MWTQEHRRQHRVGRTRAKRGYPTDVSDVGWALIEPLLPGCTCTGRLRKTDLRSVVDALRSLVRSGCTWRMMPDDFPPHLTVYDWFRRLMRRMRFRTIHDLALMLDGMGSGHEVVPTGGVL
jgi:putative transposase